MSKQTRSGFALLEVVVAMGLLAVSTLAIAEALGAALQYARAARAARRAVAVAAAVAQTFDDRAAYPAGWRVAGTPGADLLVATGDDGPPAEPTFCRRRVATTTSGTQQWVWVEATCTDSAADDPPGPRGDRVVLARAR